MSTQAVLERLPRLECGQCGYRGCLPYAEAVSSGVASIDRCTPGGLSVLRALGAVLEVDAEPYVEDMQARQVPPRRAEIDAQQCIGCYKCVDVCPVDAILGVQGHEHEVIASECSGCGLCVTACPVDCIGLEHCDGEEEVRYALRDHYALRAADRAERSHAARRQAVFWGKNRRQSYIEQAIMRKKLHESESKDH